MLVRTFPQEARLFSSIIAAVRSHVFNSEFESKKMDLRTRHSETHLRQYFCVFFMALAVIFQLWNIIQDQTIFQEANFHPTSLIIETQEHEKLIHYHRPPKTHFPNKRNRSFRCAKLYLLDCVYEGSGETASLRFSDHVVLRLPVSCGKAVGSFKSCSELVRIQRKE